MPSFLTPYLGALKIFLLIAAFGAGFGLEYKLAHRTIDNLNQQIGEYKSAYASLAATTAEQNAAINDLVARGRARAAAAKKAMEEVQKDMASVNKQAAGILAKKPPAGIDPCTAASAELDAELKSERK